jgi:hypothetical protein
MQGSGDIPYCAGEWPSDVVIPAIEVACRAGSLPRGADDQAVGRAPGRRRPGMGQADAVMHQPMTF